MLTVSSLRPEQARSSTPLTVVEQSVVISGNNRRRLLPSGISASKRENRKTSAVTVQSLRQCLESTQRPRGVSQGTGEHPYGRSLFCNIRDKLAGAQRECRALPYRAFQPS